MRLPAWSLPWTATLLLACATPARYVIVSDEAHDPRPDDASQRPVYLSRDDAQANAPILWLRTVASVREYGQARRGEVGPVENVLYALVSGRYGMAEDLLSAHSGEIPEYLRRVLVADLASERSPGVSAARLLKMYQEAYDAQESGTARAIIMLRIRQRRYGR